MNQQVVFENKTKKTDKNNPDIDVEKKIEELEEELKKTQEEVKKSKNKDKPGEDEEGKKDPNKIPDRVPGGSGYYKSLGEKVHAKPLEERQKKLYEIKKEGMEGGNVMGKGEPDKNMVVVGHQEAIRDDTKLVDQSLQKINNLVEATQKPLVYAGSIFPFPLFYSAELTVYVNKVSIKINRFLAPPEMKDFVIEDIASISGGNAFLFSAIEIVDTKDKKTLLKYLRPKQAKRARTIILGLVAAKKAAIDLSGLAPLSPDELVKKFEALGSPQPEPT